MVKRILIAVWVLDVFIGLLSMTATFLSIYRQPDTTNGLFVLNNFAAVTGMFALVLLAVLIFASFIAASEGVLD